MLFAAAFSENDIRFNQFEVYITEINKAYHIPGMALVITSPEKTLLEKTFQDILDFSLSQIHARSE